MSWIQALDKLLSKDDSAGETKMCCPRCSVKLREVGMGATSKVLLDVCPKCHGLWLDKGELDQLDKSIWANVEDHPFHLAESDHKQAVCPKCEIDLKPVSPADFSDVIVDRCPTCDGFWLDNGELDRMQDVATAIDSKASAPSGDQKPAGWSALRWKIYLLKKNETEL